MRLQQNEIDSITSTANIVFGKGTTVILFGSRVKDELKGGDIDLYIQPINKDALLKKKIIFLVALKNKIGDQKIDVILAKDESRLIEKEALTKGLVLTS